MRLRALPECLLTHPSSPQAGVHGLPPPGTAVVPALGSLEEAPLVQSGSMSGGLAVNSQGQGRGLMADGDGPVAGWSGLCPAPATALHQVTQALSSSPTL